ncbi:MAG: LPS assembly protein LptD [Granulicella sp.]
MASELPEAPGATRFPVAVPVPVKEGGQDAVIESDTQTEKGGHYVLDGNVVLTYGDRTVRADHVEYDANSGDLTATGHLVATGGANSERIMASHGTANLKTQTARFYDVSGSVGVKTTGRGLVYVSGNPFLFTGRMVVRSGPSQYEVYDGTVTSCQLPRPDWLLSAGEFQIDGEKARARNSVFRLLNIPLLYLPYVTHPVDSEDRQSGLLIPVLGQSSSKGFILGEEVYLAINRSMDLTVGGVYYSLRGWAQSATFRYKGRGYDFANAHYTQLEDRGYIPKNGIYTNQGGEDLTFRARHDFTAYTRVGADVEYLSSYPYREAFTDNFNLAVSSDILSTAYAVHEADGMMASARADRYQGLKRAAILPTPTKPGQAEQQVRIFHAPSLDFDTTDHRLGNTGLLWNLQSSSAGLKRVQPNFVTGGSIERFDLHPQIAYPLAFAGLHILPSVGVRDTYYSRNRKAPYIAGMVPVEGAGGVNRAAFETQIDLRLPVLERTFDSGAVRRFLGMDVRHTIEPELTYRYVTGVNNFLNILRFDDKDVLSDTNELEYGVTQRLFVKPDKSKACSLNAVSVANTNMTEDDLTASTKCTTSERVQWRLTQKYFFNPSFGGAILNRRRNIFDSTLSFTGVAFLTEAREISPLLSRLRVQTSERTDVEWDFDYDTGAKKFTSNNIFFDVHQGNIFGGLSYARLNAPGRFYTEGVTSAISDFSQLRVLMGYGSPTKPGLGIAANAGIDLNIGALQYAALQTSYNWNCCGISVEYRKFELGSVRNENAYRFNFTLANIGTAGNLRRAERLF